MRIKFIYDFTHDYECFKGLVCFIENFPCRLNENDIIDLRMFPKYIIKKFRIKDDYICRINSCAFQSDKIGVYQEVYFS